MADHGFSNTYELSAAVSQGEISELDAHEGIARIYNVDQIRLIAQHVGPDAQKKVNSVTGVQGRNSSYERAKKLSDACASDLELLGRAVLTAEHDQVFNLMSYFGFPANWGIDAEDFWKIIESQHGFTGTSHQFVKPFLNPGNLKPRLEAAKIADKCVTLVYGQLRVIRKMRAQSNDAANLFVARVPTLVSFLFEQKIIEISLPHFADVPMASNSSEFAHGFPGRAFNIIDHVRKSIKEYFHHPLTHLHKDNLMIYLETVKEGEDLGWDVQRLSGKKGKFDTTQRVRIPLKEILNDFTTELAKKCLAGGYVNPLEDRDLYEIFRTLKSESHTLTMDMGVALGKRAGRVELSAYYGQDADARTPLYWVLSGLTSAARDELRSAVTATSGKALKDPYSITKKFTKRET